MLKPIKLHTFKGNKIAMTIFLVGILLVLVVYTPVPGILSLGYITRWRVNAAYGRVAIPSAVKRVGEKKDSGDILDAIDQFGSTYTYSASMDAASLYRQMQQNLQNAGYHIIRTIGADEPERFAREYGANEGGPLTSAVTAVNTAWQAKVDIQIIQLPGSTYNGKPIGPLVEMTANTSNTRL